MLGRREVLQIDRRINYQTMSPSLNNSSSLSQLAAAVLGGALLAAGLMVVLANGNTRGELHVAPTVAWKLAPAVRSAPLSPVQRAANTKVFGLPVQRSTMDSGDMIIPESQASGTITTMAAFFAGCAVAVAALASRLRPQAPASPAPITMAAVTSVELEQVPAVLGTDTDPNSIHRRMEEMLRKGQESIVKAIEECDGEAKFRADAWESPGHGGGISRVLAGGKVWEKAGVNLSVLRGQMPQEALYAATEKAGHYLKRMNLKPGEPVPFSVASLSCVMHPRNPHCPTMHFNYRYFELDADNWWFAGGTDITPVYLDEEDMKHFHGTYKKVCDKYDKDFYRTFKKGADEYFLIKHRGETRGLGGIFFDDLNDRDKDTLFKFAEECLNTVVPAYVPIIEKHKADSFTEEQKRWQLIRRGRYAEFNLIYDRGTIFGLKAGGRIESILMTIPEVARWEYLHEPEPGTEEHKIWQLFKNPRDFV